MDRQTTGTVAITRQPQGSAGEGRVLPSRAAALGIVREALRTPSGPVLVTGAAGVGKTWLCRKLQAEWGSPWRWVFVDLTPATDPSGLYRLIGHALGFVADADPGESRLELSDFLQESSADAGRWVLTVDEAQNAAPGVWEEVRVLGNRLGRADGFAGMVLVGQTPLARRLGAQSLSALEVRISARVHLQPLACDEAREFLLAEMPGPVPGEEVVERWHRDSGGNPRRLLQLAARPVADNGRPARPSAPPAATRVPVSSPVPASPPPPPAPAVASAHSPAPGSAWEVPALGSSPSPRSG